MGRLILLLVCFLMVPLMASAQAGNDKNHDTKKEKEYKRKKQEMEDISSVIGGSRSGALEKEKAQQSEKKQEQIYRAEER